MADDTHPLEGINQNYEGPLSDLGFAILEINRDNGWDVANPADWDTSPTKIPALLMLIVSECAEALEGFRLGDHENFREELADIQIRLLDLAAGLAIDLDTEVAVKMEKNRSRGHRHGGKRI